MFYNCLKTPAVECCLCTHSNVLGLVLSAALPNISAAWLVLFHFITLLEVLP